MDEGNSNRPWVSSRPKIKATDGKRSPTKSLMPLAFMIKLSKNEPTPSNNFSVRLSFLSPSPPPPKRCRHHILVAKNKAPYCRVVKHIKCEGQKHLGEFLSAAENKGGEGVMLRKPLSLYEGTRSSSLWKVYMPFLTSHNSIFSYKSNLFLFHLKR